MSDISICSVCSGHGRKRQIPNRIECSLCEGKKFLYKEDRLEICSKCNGYGTIIPICTYCRGSGMTYFKF